MSSRFDLNSLLKDVPPVYVVCGSLAFAALCFGTYQLFSSPFPTHDSVDHSFSEKTLPTAEARFKRWNHSVCWIYCTKPTCEECEPPVGMYTGPGRCNHTASSCYILQAEKSFVLITTAHTFYHTTGNRVQGTKEEPFRGYCHHDDYWKVRLWDGKEIDLEFTDKWSSPRGIPDRDIIDWPYRRVNPEAVDRAKSIRNLSEKFLDIVVFKFHSSLSTELTDKGPFPELTPQWIKDVRNEVLPQTAVICLSKTSCQKYSAYKHNILAGIDKDEDYKMTEHDDREYPLLRGCSTFNIFGFPGSIFFYHNCPSFEGFSGAPIITSDGYLLGTVRGSIFGQKDVEKPPQYLNWAVRFFLIYEALTNSSPINENSWTPHPGGLWKSRYFIYNYCQYFGWTKTKSLCHVLV